MNNSQPIHFLHDHQDWVILFIFAALAALIVMNLVEIKQTAPIYAPAPVATQSGHSHCADFKTQAEAQAAFLAGAKWLDGNNDGRACQALP